MKQHRITSWQDVIKRLPESIYSFCRRYLILALPTKANLKIWNCSETNICSLCENKAETLHHIVSNCQVAADDTRYTWRHNSVLFTIISFIESININCELYADINGYNSTCLLFNTTRPDIVIKIDNVYHMIELTVCFETNLFKSHDFKMNKYRNIKLDAVNKNIDFVLYGVDFSCLGFTSENLTKFTRFLRSKHIEPGRLISKCAEVCCRASYYIFNRRGKPWTNPEILKFT
mgnify:CR=1 FL=1